MKRPSIENLKALAHLRDMTTPQKIKAFNEFETLLNYRDKLEQRIKELESDIETYKSTEYTLRQIIKYKIKKNLK